MNFLILEAVHIQGGESVANGWFFQRDGFRGAVFNANFRAAPHQKTPSIKLLSDSPDPPKIPHTW